MTEEAEMIRELEMGILSYLRDSEKLIKAFNYLRENRGSSD